MKKRDKRKKIYLLILVIIVIIIFLLLFYYNNKIVISNIEENNFDKEWIPVSEVDITNVSKNIIGYMSIPKFNNKFYENMPIKNGTELPILATSIGHFIQTPLKDGNICFAAHNSGKNSKGEYVGFFDSINKLKNGDIIYYNDLSNTYTYKVINNKVIKENDLSVLENSKENKLTLITCIKGSQNRKLRQCVVAIKI